MEIKKAATLVSYNYLMDLFNALDNDDDTEVYRQRELNHQLFYSKFCNYLRTFHVITIHLKFNNFYKRYKDCISSSCPLGGGGIKWRMHHNLEWLESTETSDGFEAICCSKNSPEPHHAVRAHFQHVILYFIKQFLNMLHIVLIIFQK